MTYLEVMTILNVDEETDQFIPSTENDKVCHVSILTKTKISKFIIIAVAAIAIFLSCNTH